MPFISDNIVSEGYISGNTMSATTFFGNGANLSNVATSTVTGGTVNRTANNTTLVFTNSTGGTFNVSTIVDTFVTGGTYSNGTLTLTNNSGNTFNITGLTTTDTYVTGFTYSNNIFTLKRNQGQSDLSVLINTMTGLTVNGTLSANTISANTFTGSGTGLTNVGLRIKSNYIDAANFTGNPKTGTVTFATPFPTTGYSITVIGGDGRSWTYESKTTSGFVINSNANQTITQPVLWTAIQNGEY